MYSSPSCTWIITKTQLSQRVFYGSAYLRISPAVNKRIYRRVYEYNRCCIIISDFYRPRIALNRFYCTDCNKWQIKHQHNTIKINYGSGWFFTFKSINWVVLWPVSYVSQVSYFFNLAIYLALMSSCNLIYLPRAKCGWKNIHNNKRNRNDDPVSNPKLQNSDNTAKNPHCYHGYRNAAHCDRAFVSQVKR